MSNNIFLDLGFEESIAKGLLIKADLMIQIETLMVSLGETRPRWHNMDDYTAQSLNEELVRWQNIAKGRDNVPSN